MSMKRMSIGLLLGVVIGSIAAKTSSRKAAPKFAPTQPSLSKAPQPINGMAQNEHEMKKLGDSMKEMPTNTEVAESGMIPDPIQYEKE
jgi:hypothetical protein